jgi:hypothetical protein
MFLLRAHYDESVVAAARARLSNDAEFSDTISELALLFALHRANNWLTSTTQRLPMPDYHCGTKGPDITFPAPAGGQMGIEVRRLAESSQELPARLGHESDRRFLRAFSAKLEEKVGQLEGCRLKVIAVDVTTKLGIGRPLWTQDSADFKVRGQLLGTLKAYWYPDGNREGGYAHDPNAVPSEGDEEASPFFKLHPEIGAVIVFAYGFDGGDDFLVCSSLHLNPHSPAESLIPPEVAYALQVIMNGAQWLSVSSSHVNLNRISEETAKASSLVTKAPDV